MAWKNGEWWECRIGEVFVQCLYFNTSKVETPDDIQEWWGGGWHFLACIPATALAAWWCREHPDAPEFCCMTWHTQSLWVNHCLIWLMTNMQGGNMSNPRVISMMEWEVMGSFQRDWGWPSARSETATARATVNIQVKWAVERSSAVQRGYDGWLMYMTCRVCTCGTRVHMVNFSDWMWWRWGWHVMFTTKSSTTTGSWTEKCTRKIYFWNLIFIPIFNTPNSNFS